MLPADSVMEIEHLAMGVLKETFGVWTGRVLLEN
jgi:hypothetical protein